MKRNCDADNWKDLLLWIYSLWYNLPHSDDAVLVMKGSKETLKKLSILKQRLQLQRSVNQCMINKEMFHCWAIKHKRWEKVNFWKLLRNNFETNSIFRFRTIGIMQTNKDDPPTMKMRILMQKLSPDKQNSFFIFL